MLAKDRINQVIEQVVDVNKEFVDAFCMRAFISLSINGEQVDMTKLDGFRIGETGYIYVIDSGGTCENGYLRVKRSKIKGNVKIAFKPV